MPPRTLRTVSIALVLGALTQMAGCPGFPSGGTSLQVDAGADQTLIWPFNLVELQGQVTPADGVNVVWEVDADASTNTDVVFFDAHALKTTATFSEPGTYVLVLKATRGTATAQDTLTVAIDVSPWSQEAKLLPDGGAEDDLFGSAVALDGDRAVIGAMGRRHDDGSTGAVYVFTRSDGTWTSQAQLLPDPDTVGNYFAKFGGAVAVSGDYIIVGAHWDAGSGQQSGAVYIYRWTGSQWTQQTRIVPDDVGEGDEFGFSVAADGDRIVIGTHFDDVLGTDSGSAYVYRRVADAWIQEAKLVPDDGSEGDQFGSAVAIDGDRIAVCAQLDDDNGTDSGSAYVFRLVNGQWQQETKLLPDDGVAGQYFGSSVALRGDRAAIGAARDADNGSWSGAVYVFRATTEPWALEAKIKPPDGARNDLFGTAVAMDGDRLVVGAIGDGDAAPDGGSIYVFRRNGSQWVQEGKLLASDADSNDRLGSAVALSGDRVLAGADFNDDNGSSSGSAYVFVVSGGP